MILIFPYGGIKDIIPNFKKLISEYSPESTGIFIMLFILEYLVFIIIKWAITVKYGDWKKCYNS